MPIKKMKSTGGSSTGRKPAKKSKPVGPASPYGYATFEELRREGATFAERIGKPEEEDAALGRVAISFSYLEDTARNVILMLAETPAVNGKILTAQLSFRQKLDALGALFKRWQSDHRTEPDAADLTGRLTEVLRLCRRAEELRNTYLHSSYGTARRQASGEWRTYPARAKTSARQDGLRIVVEELDSGLLLDVADFILNTAVILEEIPAYLDLADTIGGDGHRMYYLKKGVTVAEFRFGE